MSTTDGNQGAGAGAVDGGNAAVGETAQPELQDAGLAHQQDDAGEAAADQSKDVEGEADKGLTDEQKTIRKLQRRIDRLTAKRGGTERENELLRQQLEQASRQLQTAVGQQEEGSEGQGGQRKQLTEADIERIANERAADLHRKQTIAQRVGKVLETGRKLDGFDAAVDAVAEVVPFTDRRGRPTPFIEAVLDADDPAAVLKHLGENPDEAEDLADLTPAQLGRRLAKLEDRLKQGAKKTTSAAPPPLRPVAGNSSSSEPSPNDTARWIAWRNKQATAAQR